MSSIDAWLDHAKTDFLQTCCVGEVTTDRDNSHIYLLRNGKTCTFDLTFDLVVDLMIIIVL